MADEALMRQVTLDHTARLAILGEMASAIAHELNQPLAAIGNFARGMARRITAGRLEPVPLLEGTSEIVTQSERAAGIIRNIRAFAQKRSSERKLLDLKLLSRFCLKPSPCLAQPILTLCLSGNPQRHKHPQK